MISEGKIQLLSFLNSDPGDSAPPTCGGSTLKHSSPTQSFPMFLEESMLYQSILVMFPKYSCSHMVAMTSDSYRSG